MKISLKMKHKKKGGILICYKKSAKDLAFDKERAKYSSTIKDLKRELKKKDETICELEYIVSKRDTKIAEQEDWIERLLEFSNLSKEEMEKFLVNQKSTQEVFDELHSLKKGLLNFGLFSGI